MHHNSVTAKITRLFATVCLILPFTPESAAFPTLNSTWDSIYQYRGFIPNEPSVSDNYNVTSILLPISRSFDPLSGIYSDDIAMIGFDLRSIRGLTSFKAGLVIVREDGDLLNPFSVNIFVVDDDGVGTRSDFFQAGFYAGTRSVPPRPNGIDVQETLIDFTDAVHLALDAGMEFAAFRLEAARSYEHGYWTHYIHSSRYGIYNTPRLEITDVPEPETLALLSLGLVVLAVSRRRERKPASI